MASKFSKQPFVHLRVHSAYSLLEGALPIAKLVELAQKHAMPALALSDTNNLFGALEFSEYMAKAGVQPIIGCTLTVEFASAGQGDIANETRPDPRNSGTLALFVPRIQEGYANLLKLSSSAFLDSDAVSAPFVTIDMLSRHCGGLIALTGGGGRYRRPGA